MNWSWSRTLIVDTMLQWLDYKTLQLLLLLLGWNLPAELFWSHVDDPNVFAVFMPATKNAATLALGLESYNEKKIMFVFTRYRGQIGFWDKPQEFYFCFNFLEKFSRVQDYTFKEYWVVNQQLCAW